MLTQLYSDVEERRDRVQIFSDILRVTKKPTKITKILRVANVQYSTFQEYVDMLIEADLLEKVPVDKKSSTRTFDQRTNYFFRATQTGQNWCNLVKEIYGIFRYRKGE